MGTQYVICGRSLYAENKYMGIKAAGDAFVIYEVARLLFLHVLCMITFWNHINVANYSKPAAFLQSATITLLAVIIIYHIKTVTISFLHYIMLSYIFFCLEQINNL